jgi:hypothetical protein
MTRVIRLMRAVSSHPNHTILAQKAFDPPAVVQVDGVDIAEVYQRAQPGHDTHRAATYAAVA